jgi:hypothetical protein
MPIQTAQSTPAKHGSFSNLNPACPLCVIKGGDHNMARKMAHLIQLTTEKTARAERDAELLREDLFEKCTAAVHDLGDDISGYALIVWSKNGDMRTAYNAARGPIGPALVPTLAADALNRHVAVMLAREDESDDAGTS